MPCVSPQVGLIECVIPAETLRWSYAISSHSRAVQEHRLKAGESSVCPDAYSLCPSGQV